MGDAVSEKQYITDSVGKWEILEGNGLKLVEPSPEYIAKRLQMQEEEEFLKALTPTEDEIMDAEIEIKILNTLMEVGLL